MQTFTRRINVPSKWNDETRRFDEVTLVEVTLEVNVDALFTRLGRRAWINSTKQAVEASGKIKATAKAVL